MLALSMESLFGSQLAQSSHKHQDEWTRPQVQKHVIWSSEVEMASSALQEQMTNTASS